MLTKITNRINKNLVVLADQAMFSGGSFVITILLARSMGIENFGVYSSFTLFNYAIINILNAIVVSPFQVSQNGIAATKSYLSFNFWLQMVLVVVFCIAIQSIMLFDFEAVRALKEIGIGFTLYFIGFVMHDFLRKVFLAKSEVYKALIIDSVTTAFQMLIMIVNWLYFQASFKEILLFLGIAYVPTLLIGIIFIKPNFNQFSSWWSFVQLHYQQGKWLLVTTFVQWWSGNIFVVTSGLLLGVETLGAFRLVQSLFGVLNVLLQTFENYALPEACRLFVQSSDQAKLYLKKLSAKSAIVFGGVLAVLFLFSDQVMLLAGGASYIPYSFIIKGMVVLYAFIFIGYPIRISIRMLVLNRAFFVGYLISLVFSLLSYHFLLEHWNVNGAIAGLIASQLIVISYWQYVLTQKQFVLWK